MHRLVGVLSVSFGELLADFVMQFADPRDGLTEVLWSVIWNHMVMLMEMVVIIFVTVSVVMVVAVTVSVIMIIVLRGGFA